MPYTRDDVDRAERRIRAAAPSALIERDDFGFALHVADRQKRIAFVVYQPPIDELGQVEIISDVDAIVTVLASLERRH